jgi:hypothetical protein
MKKPPKHLFGYDSWTEMFDCLIAENPDMLKAGTIFYTYQTSPEADAKVFKISIKTLQAKCWEELQDYRLEKDYTARVIDMIKKGHIDSILDADITIKSFLLLKAIQIQDNL